MMSIPVSTAPLDQRGPQEIAELLGHLDDGGLILAKTAYEGQQDYIMSLSDWRIVGRENEYVIHYPIPHLKQIIDRDQMWAQIRYARADLIAYV